MTGAAFDTCRGLAFAAAGDVKNREHWGITVQGSSPTAECGVSSMKKIALLSLLATFLATVSVFAQQPKFEIADVHVSATARGFAQNFGGVPRAGRYVNRDATMLNLIEAAYGVSEDGISGGPGWLASDLFDVIAKVPDGTTPATANYMLQGLLADRFGLTIRNEARPVPRFVLSVGNGGSQRYHRFRGSRKRAWTEAGEAKEIHSGDRRRSRG